jgi:hypothetical protein
MCSDSTLGQDDLARFGQALRGKTTLTCLNGFDWSCAAARSSGGGIAAFDARGKEAGPDGLAVLGAYLAGFQATLTSLDLRCVSFPFSFCMAIIFLREISSSTKDIAGVIQYLLNRVLSRALDSHGLNLRVLT